MKKYMSKWNDFDREAQTIKMVTTEKSPECVQLLQDAVGLFAEGFYIGENSDTTDETHVRMSLLSQNLGTLKCSVDLAL